MGHLDGRCLCGSITYTSSADEPLLTGICHCSDCQRSTGSAFSIIVGVPLESLEISGESLKVFDTMGEDREAIAHRSFCGDCGSPIMSVLDDMPAMAVLKAGTLDDTSWLQPDLEFWARSAQPWAVESVRDDRTCLQRGMPEA